MVDKQLEITNLVHYNNVNNNESNRLKSFFQSKKISSSLPLNINHKQRSNNDKEIQTDKIINVENSSQTNIIIHQDEEFQTDIVNNVEIEIQTDEIFLIDKKILFDQIIQTDIVQCIDDETQTETINNNMETQTVELHKITMDNETDTNDLIEIFNKYLVKNKIGSSDIEYDYSHRNIVIDNMNKCFLTIGDGKENEIKDIYQMYPSLNETIINTSFGSFYLDKNNNHQKIIYVDDVNKWKIIDSKNNQFFPSWNLQEINSYDKSGFGSSFAISGNNKTVVVGSFLSNNCIGSVGIYESHNLFTPINTIYGYDNIGESFQGIAVAINYNSNIIVIGGSGDNDGCGACWIFVKNDNWEQLKKITAENTLSSDTLSTLGDTLSTLGDTLSTKGDTQYFGKNIVLSLNGKSLFVSSSNNVWIYDDTFTLKECLSSDNDNFGSLISTNFDGSLFAINDFNSIKLYRQNPKITQIKTINITGNLNSFCLNACGEKLLFGYDNKLCMYDNDKISHVKCGLSNKKITSCCMCENGNTILITGINSSDNYFVQILTTKNKEYISYNHTEFPYYQMINLSSVLSLDGKFGLIGCDMYDNYNGICWSIK